MALPTELPARWRLGQVKFRLEEDEERYRDAVWKQRNIEQQYRNNKRRDFFEEFTRPVFFAEKPNEHFDGLAVWQA